MNYWVFIQKIVPKRKIYENNIKDQHQSELKSEQQKINSKVFSVLFDWLSFFVFKH